MNPDLSYEPMRRAHEDAMENIRFCDICGQWAYTQRQYNAVHNVSYRVCSHCTGVEVRCDMKNHWFGNEPFGPACDGLTKVVTPVGKKCSWCDEAIVEGDEGIVMPHVYQLEKGQPVMDWLPVHRECFLRQVLGSVNHQMGLCSCGKPKTYPHMNEGENNMTRRQAAIAAVQYYEKNLRMEQMVQRLRSDPSWW